MIVATSISEFWWAAVCMAADNGYRQDIERGSFAGEAYRRQLPWLSGEITSPLFDMIPVAPEGWVVPTTREQAERYFHDYLLHGRQPHANETYTYATRIGWQLDEVVAMLKDTPQTNQASITVGRPEDLRLEHPACLRLIDFKAVAGRLNLASFWRSHDLYSGLPENLAGLAMLQEVVAELSGLTVGSMYYATQGGHIYSHHESVINP